MEHNVQNRLTSRFFSLSHSWETRLRFKYKEKELISEMSWARRAAEAAFAGGKSAFTFSFRPLCPRLCFRLPFRARRVSFTPLGAELFLAYFAAAARRKETTMRKFASLAKLNKVHELRSTLPKSRIGTPHSIP